MPAALVFDNSLRMQYEHENKTRLEQAKELAGWLLEQIPAESPVTVVDRAGRQRGQDMDRAAAELRVERLELSAAVRPMEDALRDAAHWLEDKRDYRGEIYVFTDLAAEAWPQDDAAELRQAARCAAGRERVFDRRRAPRSRRTWASVRCGFRASSWRRADCCGLNTELVAIGAGWRTTSEDAAGRAVELYVGDGAGKPEKRGQQVVRAKRRAAGAG